MSLGPERRAGRFNPSEAVQSSNIHNSARRGRRFVPVSVMTRTGGGEPPSNSSDDEDVSNTVENERWKYLATFFNTVAAASIAVGIITPTSGILAKGPGAITEVDAFVYGGFALIWLGVAGALHLSAQCVLGNLRP